MSFSRCLALFRLSVFAFCLTSARAEETLLTSTIEKEIPLWQTGKAAYLHSLCQDIGEIRSDTGWKSLTAVPGRIDNGYYWVRFSVKNDLPDSAYVDFVAFQADSILLFTGTSGSIPRQMTGTFVKPHEWAFPEYPELTYVFCAPGESIQVFMRLSASRGGKFTLGKLFIQPRPVTLKEVVAGYRVYTPRTEFNGFFLGAVMVMMVFFFFLSFRIEEKALLFYAIYLLGAACYALIVKSLPYSHLARLAYLDYELTYKLGEPVQYFFFAAYAWFGKHLLDIDHRYGLLYRFLRLLTAGLMIAGLALLTANLTSFNYMFQEKAYVAIRILLLPTALLLIIWISWTVENPIKWFFIAGSSFFIAGGLVAFLMDPKSRHLFFGNTYINPIVAFKSGILLESLCFAIALSFKLRLIRTEKEKATNALIEQMELNRRLVATENERLEKMVKERAAEIIEKNTLLENQRQQQLKSDFEKQLAEMEMQALRSQMNPHFIFNSLNSIRHQILTRNYENAGDYLMRFAKLLRQILQNSREHVIPLSEEIDLIRLYLQLEQLRFGDLFRYHLAIDPELDAESILIPSMLLQPYVENALKHGIAVSRRLPGRIDIRVRETPEGFRYEIEDNGIGREAAFRKNTPGEKPGLGLKITNERIVLFNANYNQCIKVVYEDLKDAAQKPLGTKVIITHTDGPPKNSI